MTTRARDAQRGTSLPGLLLLGVLLALVGIVGARVVPTATEFMAIQKAVERAAAEGDSVAAVRASFDRSASAEAISSLAGRDLEVTRLGEQMVAGFAYDKEIPLFGPAYLLIKYRGSSRSD